MTNMRLLSILLFSVVLISCAKEEPIETPASNNYSLNYDGLPTPVIPDDNPLTKNGVALGRKLFYETRLSSDGSISCSSCHLQENAFSDTNRFSSGVNGLNGTRQSMAIFNMAWNNNEFFWDGRAHLLRDQTLMPIEDPLEMAETLANVIKKLKKDPDYVQEFEVVFGSSGINAFNISLALEQFLHSIVSNNSRYDQYLRNEISLSPSELAGRELFFRSYNPDSPSTPFANCSQCHSGPNFENDSYMNNGLDFEMDITDLGRAKVTNSIYDIGKFKVPTLRNIALTPPYMHDGRFSTLEETINHYSEGIKASPTASPTLLSVAQLGPLLNEQQKVDLIAFLHTLTDNKLITDPKYSDPF